MTPLIEAGNIHIDRLNLSPDEQAILREHFVRHVRYPARGGDVRCSVFRDVPAVAQVLRLRERAA